MTALLTAEFEDEQGVTRRLTRRDPALHQRRRRRRQRDHEPADRLGGKVLAEHPDQRREPAEDRSLVNGAIEELLRFESPGPIIARYVARDVELHGQTVPEGSAILFLVGAANRDERRFPDGDRFDIHRSPGPPRIRVRHPLLPGCCARPPRGSDRRRRGPAAVSDVGRRPGQRTHGVDVHGAGLGVAAGVHPIAGHAPTGANGRNERTVEGDHGGQRVPRSRDRAGIADVRRLHRRLCEEAR